jgi:hypothetical protein
MVKVLRLLVALIAAGSMLAACGGDDDDSSADADVDADIGASANVSDECIDASRAMAAASSGVSSAFAGGSDDLDDSVKQLSRFADDAPDEIKADMKVVAKAYGEFATAIVDADFEAGKTPSPEQMAELQEIAASLDEDDFKDAADHVQDWLAEHCSK